MQGDDYGADRIGVGTKGARPAGHGDDDAEARVRVAIVTAGSEGIGAACARELAARGWTVVVFARSERTEVVAREIGGMAVRGSLTEPADLERLVRETLDRFGRIDGVVLNAGHPPKGELLELSDDEWRAGVDMLLMSAVRMARLVTPAMLEQGGGAFVNVSSFTALEPSAPRPVSSAMRAALSSFTKLYADRYAADGIRVNAILPGWVATRPEEPAIVEDIPAGRYAKPAEIARVVAFLLSDEASYVTGESLRADGGLSRSM